MNSGVVFLSYFAAFGVAVFLLWRFSHVSWYWHLLSVFAALCIGLMPPISADWGAGYDLTVGSAFVFLLVWGLADPFFRVLHIPHHA